MPTADRDDAALPEVHDQALFDFVQDAAERHRVPGVCAGILHRGVTRIVAHGITSTADPQPVDTETLFMIGSTTKTLTATTVMALVADGALRLEDRVQSHLADFRLADPEAAADVTVLHVLNHTGGWAGDAIPSLEFGPDALSRAVEQSVTSAQGWSPGEHMSYNNAAFLVAGRLIEAVTGQAYEDVVTERVLRPLGMNATFFHPWEVALRKTATGHLHQDDALSPYVDWPIGRGLAPAGGAWSTIYDQLTWAAFQLGVTTPSSPPLTRDDVQLMHSPTTRSGSTPQAVGLAWLLNTYNTTRLVSHGGNISNLFTSSFDLAPDAQLAVTVLGNSRGSAAVGQELLHWALDHYCDVPAPPPLEPLTLSGSRLVEYTGTYDLDAWLLEVTADDDRLMVQMLLPAGAPEELVAAFQTPPVEYVFVGDDQIAPAGKPTQAAGDFIRGRDGDVQWLRSGMRMGRRTRATPRP